MVDLDPDAFGAVCDWAGRFVNRPSRELHVLHQRGAVVRATEPLDQDHLGPDLAAAARSLRQRLGVDRVVLADVDGLRALAPALAAAGAPDQDQPTMLRRCAALFWGSDAVVTDPAPPADAWAVVADLLAALPSPSTVSIAGFEATVVDGRVTEVRSR
jgi:hypothetical protein